MPPADVKLDDDPEVYRRDLVYNWVRSYSSKQLQELMELENLFKLVKGTTDDIIYEKLVKNKGELNKKDLLHFKLLKEILVDLHKLKHGTKNVTMNVGYNDIREMMFGKDADTPDK